MAASSPHSLEVPPVEAAVVASPAAVAPEALTAGRVLENLAYSRAAKHTVSKPRDDSVVH